MPPGHEDRREVDARPAAADAGADRGRGVPVLARMAAGEAARIADPADRPARLRPPSRELPAGVPAHPPRDDRLDRGALPARRIRQLRSVIEESVPASLSDLWSSGPTPSGGRHIGRASEDDAVARPAPNAAGRAFGAGLTTCTVPRQRRWPVRRGARHVPRVGRTVGQVSRRAARRPRRAPGPRASGSGPDRVRAGTWHVLRGESSDPDLERGGPVVADACGVHEAHAATSLRGRPRGRLRADRRAALEDLAAPDAPRLAAVEGAGEAGVANRAVGAEALGELELRRRLGEPQVRVLDPARQRRRIGARATGVWGRLGGEPGPGSPGRRSRTSGGRSSAALPLLLRLRWPAETADRWSACRVIADGGKAADPGFGSAAWWRTGRALAQRSPRGMDPEVVAMELCAIGATCA